MNRKNRISGAVALLAAIALPACGPSGAGPDEGGETKVVASNSIVADLVENVAGGEAEVTALVGPREDVHNFGPSPSASAELAEAAVVFENGLELEPWMDGRYESSGTEAARIPLAESNEIEWLTAEDDHGHGDHEDEHAEEHEEGRTDEHGHEDHAHGEYDPHVWHDARNAIHMVREAEATLSEADPENAGAYEENADEYVAELEELDGEIERLTGEVLEENRRLVTAHDTFGYFVEAYGFEVVGTGLDSFSTEASDPAAGKTAELADEIQEAGVPAIFPENVSNPALMQRIADEAGVDLAPPLYTDALGEPGGEAGTYVDMMRYNAAAISDALG